MQEMTPTDAWVSNLLANVIAQVVSSIKDRGEIDPAKDIGVLELTFEHEYEVRMRIQFSDVDRDEQCVNLD